MCAKRLLLLGLLHLEFAEFRPGHAGILIVYTIVIAESKPYFLPGMKVVCAGLLQGAPREFSTTEETEDAERRGGSVKPALSRPEHAVDYAFCRLSPCLSVEGVLYRLAKNAESTARLARRRSQRKCFAQGWRMSSRADGKRRPGQPTSRATPR